MTAMAIRRARINAITFWTLGGAAAVFSALQLGLVPERLGEIGDRAEYILGRMLPPVVDQPMSLASAALQSIQIAVVGTVYGILLSAMLAALAARNISPLGPLSWGIKAFAALVRAIPALVWALLFIVAVGLGPTAGILALAVNSTGMLVKVYAETIEEIPPGPIEALRAAGAGRVQVATQAILPAVAEAFISWSVFRFDINVRYASILGIVGAGGIGWELARAAQVGAYDQALGVTMVIFAMVLAAEYGSKWLQRRTEVMSMAYARGA